MSSFLKNIALTFSSRFLSAIFTSLSTILIARAFGPIGKGVFTMVAFFPALALQFGHLGLGNANTYLIAQDKEKTKKAFYNSFWYGLIIGWLFIIIFASIYRYSPATILGKGDIGNWAFYLSLFTIPFILWENFYQGIFVGRHEFKFFNFSILLSKLILFLGLVILVFCFKVSIANLKIAVIYYAITLSLPSIIYGLFFMINYGPPFEFNSSFFSKAMRFGIRSYIACLSSFLVLRSDMYLVNFYLGLKYTGLYSIAVGFGDGILMLVSSTALVLLPKIIANQNNSIETVLKTSRGISWIMLVILLAAFVFGRYALILLFGNNFLDALPAFYMLLPALYFWAISSVLTQLFVSWGYPWFSVLIWLPGLFINIILNIILIPKYGIVAAAGTSLVAYFVIFILHYYYYRKYNKATIKDILYPPLDEIKSLLKNMKNIFNISI